MQERVIPREATYADLEAVPPHLVAEILEGRLVTHPRPAPRPTYTASALGRILGGSYDWKSGGSPGGWWILDEPELHLGRDVAVPDLSGWRTERMPKLPATAFFELAPDWVCEVLTPSTARYNKGEKRDLYARHGVKHLWHVDPPSQLLESFELRQSHWALLRTYRDDEQVDGAPFGAAPFGLALLWAD